MNRVFLGPALALVIGAGYSFNAVAQVKPEVLVEQRQAAMILQAKYLYSLLPMAQGRIPYDGAIVARNAGYLDVLIRMAWDSFEPSTQGVKSRALPEVYSDPAKFKAAQETMFAEMAKFVAIVKTGNEASIKPAIVDLNKACNACHETFRQRQQ
ncbi:MAG: cytochrome c [Burkholderiaceae bacterium]